MSKGLRPVAAGAVSLVVLLALSGFTTRGSAPPIPGRLVAYDLRTGAVRFDVPTASASASIHTVSPGVVAVTGASSCRRLHVRRPLLSAYSRSTGARLWVRPVSAAAACASLPTAVATHGVIAFGDLGGLLGVSTLDGSTRWRLAGAGPSLTTPEGIVTVEGVQRPGSVEFVDGGTGRIERMVTVRSLPTPWFLTARTAIVWAQRGTVAPRLRLVAIDRVTGRQRWTRTLPASLGWPSGADGVLVESWQTVPGYVADSSELATATGQDTVTTAAFEVRTGRRLWRRVDPSTEPFSRGRITAGAGLALFVQGRTLAALDLHTGVTRWRVRLSSWNAGDSMVAGGGLVAVIDSTDVTAFGARDGSKHWSRPVRVPGTVSHGPAVLTDGLLLIPSTSTSFIPYDG